MQYVPPTPLGPPPRPGCGLQCANDTDCDKPGSMCKSCSAGKCAPPSRSAESLQCPGVTPGTALRGVAARLLRAPQRLSDWVGIAAAHGGVAIPARVLDRGYNAPPFSERTLPLRDYLASTVFAPDGAAGRDALYMQQVDLFGLLPQLAGDAGVPQEGPRALCNRLPATEHAGYFVCPRGVTTPLHVDNGDFSTSIVTRSRGNLFVQLSGRKRVVLIPPTVADARRGELYPSDGERWAHVSRAHRAVKGCRANTTAFAEWPELEHAWERRTEFVLGAGDGVLIPSWWWHCTEALDDGAAVNWWFDEGL